VAGKTMNREIKFRMWGGHAEIMLYDSREVFITLSGRPHFWTGDNVLIQGKHWNENTPLMQYTGIKDIKGKEIYEGDIISVDEPDTRCPTNGKRHIIQSFSRAVVMWSNTRLCYDYSPVIDGQYNVPHQMLCYGANIKILGNIFENPDLIKS
jgi:uncharacterized phage protein (TIGR01671 family)